MQFRKTRPPSADGLKMKKALKQLRPDTSPADTFF
jgi:hypothetical protein